MTSTYVNTYQNADLIVNMNGKLTVFENPDNNRLWGRSQVTINIVSKCGWVNTGGSLELDDISVYRSPNTSDYSQIIWSSENRFPISPSQSFDITRAQGLLDFYCVISYRYHDKVPPFKNSGTRSVSFKMFNPIKLIQINPSSGYTTSTNISFYNTEYLPSRFNYKVSYGDESPTTIVSSETISHTYNNPGSYEFKYYEYFKSESIEKEIRPIFKTTIIVTGESHPIPPTPPPGPDGDPSPPPASFKVSTISESTYNFKIGGSAIDVTWYFGDGNSSSGNNVSYKYKTPGIYTPIVKYKKA